MMNVKSIFRHLYDFYNIYMIKMSDIIEIVKNNDLTSLKEKKLNTITLYNLLTFAIDNNCSDDIIHYLIKDRNYIHNDDYILSIKKVNMIILNNKNLVKKPILHKFDCILIAKQLLKHDDEIIIKIVNSKYIEFIETELLYHLSINFTDENKKLLTIMLNESNKDKYYLIRNITHQILSKDNNSIIIHDFCNFCIYYLKDNEKLLNYIFFIGPITSISLLKEINFTLSLTMQSLDKNNKIYNIIDLLQYLSNDDNFVEFAKINEKYLMTICDNECKKYIQTFI